MAQATITTAKSEPKNHVEIRNELRNGTTIEYVVVDGQKIGILGSVNEKDRELALEVLNKAYIESGSSIPAMIAALNNIASDAEREITPDEVVDVNGVQIEICYDTAKAYRLGGDEIANCDDLDYKTLPAEAIKALLVSRAENVIATEIENEIEYDDEDDDDDDYLADIIAAMM